MAAKVNTAEDVVTFLRGQHEQIREMFAEVRASAGAAREEKFVALRRLLAVHETAEEQVVHPRARKDLADGERIVGERLEEEREAKVMLARIEGMDITSAQFDEMLHALERSVLAHADAEERDEFSTLANIVDDDQLAKMRKAVEMSERMAPTRPHPGVESPTANMLVGPFASMLDRARDALTGKG